MNRDTISKFRLLIGVGIIILSLISYFSSSEYNTFTGEEQYVSLTVSQEIALGLQAVPELIQENGGLTTDEVITARVNRIGDTLAERSIVAESPYEFEFYVIDDPDLINAFALPGGPVFISTGLIAQLNGDDEIAGVLSHEIVHVVARHGAQRIANSDLLNGVVIGVAVASERASASQTTAMIGYLINLQYGRDHESQSDQLGVCLMLQAGYDPNGLIGVMQVLESNAANDDTPEFLLSHPSPANRIQQLEAIIANPSAYCP